MGISPSAPCRMRCLCLPCSWEMSECHVVTVSWCQGHGSAWQKTQARLAWRGSCQAAALVGNPGQGLTSGLESLLDRDVTQTWVCSGCCGSHQPWAMSLSPGNTPKSAGASGGIGVLDKHQVTATQLQRAQSFSLFLKLAVTSSSSRAWRVLIEGAGKETTATQFPVPGSQQPLNSLSLDHLLHPCTGLGVWGARGQCEHKHGQLQCCSQGEVFAHSPGLS